MKIVIDESNTVIYSVNAALELEMDVLITMEEKKKHEFTEFTGYRKMSHMHGIPDIKQ